MEVAKEAEGRVGRHRDGRQCVGTTAASGKAATRFTPPFREIGRNGYIYRIDDRRRTRRVSGAITVGVTAIRSRRVQAAAGGADRRRSDDGGHYIAARFNGPGEAFNHFAQDANFNRGGYRALEDQWARAKRQGKSVSVKIVPIYVDGSGRPDIIDVIFFIDGSKESIRFPNVSKEK